MRTEALDALRNWRCTLLEAEARINEIESRHGQGFYMWRLGSVVKIHYTGRPGLSCKQTRTGHPCIQAIDEEGGIAMWNRHAQPRQKVTIGSYIVGKDDFNFNRDCELTNRVHIPVSGFFWKGDRDNDGGVVDDGTEFEIDELGMGTTLTCAIAIAQERAHGEVLSNGEFLDHLEAYGKALMRNYSRASLWDQNTYSHHGFQIAYIRKHFWQRSSNAEHAIKLLQDIAMMEAEEVQQSDFYSHTSGDIHSRLKDFFIKLKGCNEVRIVDLSGGPGRSAVGVVSFLNEWLDGKLQDRHVTVLDPVQQWEWCSRALGFDFHHSSSLADMMKAECSQHADILLISWAMDFATDSFWQEVKSWFHRLAEKAGLMLVHDREQRNPPGLLHKVGYLSDSFFTLSGPL